MATVDWSLVYRPRAVIGAVNFDMPLPLMQTNERYNQVMEEIKVPLQNGVIVAGVSRGSLTVSFDGILSRNTLSGLMHTKDAMMDLFINNAGTPFTFYRYYDNVKGNYRWFENCLCKELSFTMVNNQVYTMAYSMQLLVPSGLEKALITTTGESPSNTSGNLSGRIYGGVSQGDEKYSFVTNVDSLPDDRTLLYGPMLIKLPDTDGTSAFMIMDGDGNIIFKVDSSGRIKSLKPVALVRSIAVTE